MDPFEPLKYERPLQQLKARIAAEGSKAVFSPLIEKFILKNAHRVTVEMQVSRKLVTSVMVAFSLWVRYNSTLNLQPDPEKASCDEAAEKEILKQVKASMTQEDLAELARATKELKEKQETPDPPEALKAVPSLSLHDIPKKPTHVPIEVFFCGLDLLPIVCFLFFLFIT
jgi:presequence protease